MVEGLRTNLRKGESKAIVFLGGGRITSALVAGLRLARDARAIVVYDRNPEKMRALRPRVHGLAPASWRACRIRKAIDLARLMQ